MRDSSNGNPTSSRGAKCTVLLRTGASKKLVNYVLWVSMISTRPWRDGAIAQEAGDQADNKQQEHWLQPSLTTGPNPGRRSRQSMTVIYGQNKQARGAGVWRRPT